MADLKAGLTALPYDRLRNLNLWSIDISSYFTDEPFLHLVSTEPTLPSLLSSVKWDREFTFAQGPLPQIFPKRARFRSLHLSKMEPVARKSQEFAALQAYTRDTHGVTHRHYGVEVLHAYRVERSVPSVVGR